MSEMGGYTTDYIPCTNRAYYRRARRVLIKNVGKHCVECGTTERLEAHHIDKDIKNCDISNLVWLCRGCHEFYHGIKEDYSNDDKC